MSKTSVNSRQFVVALLAVMSLASLTGCKWKGVKFIEVRLKKQEVNGKVGCAAYPYPEHAELSRHMMVAWLVANDCGSDQTLTLKFSTTNSPFGDEQCALVLPLATDRISAIACFAEGRVDKYSYSAKTGNEVGSTGLAMPDIEILP